MRLFLTTLLGVIAVMTSAMVMPNDKSGDLIRRSPIEQDQSQTRDIEAKCYLGSGCLPDWPRTFPRIYRFNDFNSFRTSGYFPNFAPDFTSINVNGWNQITSSIGVLTNTLNSYGQFLLNNPADIDIIRNSIQNIIETIFVIARQVNAGFPRWGSFDPYINSFGPIFAEFWEALFGFLQYCDNTFGFDTIIQRNSLFYNRLNTSITYLTQNFGPYAPRFGPFLRQRNIDFGFFQRRLGFSFTSFSGVYVGRRQTTWTTLSSRRGRSINGFK